MLYTAVNIMYVHFAQASDICYWLHKHLKFKIFTFLNNNFRNKKLSIVDKGCKMSTLLLTFTGCLTDILFIVISFKFINYINEKNFYLTALLLSVLINFIIYLTHHHFHLPVYHCPSEHPQPAYLLPLHPLHHCPQSTLSALQPQ